MTDTPAVIARPVYAARLPVPIVDFSKISDALTTLHGEDFCVEGHGSYLVFFTAGDTCGCRYCSNLIGQTMATCDPGRDFATGVASNPVNRMIVCATCGFKRCPHATDHNNDCTGSNEPGQAGSSYQ